MGTHIPTHWSSGPNASSDLLPKWTHTGSSLDLGDVHALVRVHSHHIVVLVDVEWRRFISGMYFAEASLYLNFACILAAFTISKPLDEKGEEITPPAEFEGGGEIR
jgi:hypothetical protein